MIQPVRLAGRILPALFLAALAAACTSMPDPSLGPPKVAGFVQTDPVDAVVVIDRRCHASPEHAVIDFADDGSAKRNQVVWVADKRDGETLRITPKPAARQDRFDRDRGLAIRALFGSGFESGAGPENAIRSGPPVGRPPFRGGEVEWRYDVQIVGADGANVCRYDPVICVRDRGSSGCDY